MLYAKFASVIQCVRFCDGELLATPGIEKKNGGVEDFVEVAWTGPGP